MTLDNTRFTGIEKFDKKIWLASPTMHGDEQKWVDEANPETIRKLVRAIVPTYKPKNV